MKTTLSLAWKAGHAPALLAEDARQGLSSFEARKRLAIYGCNRLTTAARPSKWRRFFEQFRQPLIYVLLVAAALSFYLGQRLDAGVILGVVLCNAIVGYLQENKAEQAILALGRMMQAETIVRRDGRKQKIPTLYVVPGDIVFLQAGDHIPADLELLEVNRLQIDESPLTGESRPIFKTAAMMAEANDRTSTAFAGTAVVAGRGEGVVRATGDQTEMGGVARLISEALDVGTPLTRKFAQFTRLLLWLVLVLSLITFVVGIWRGQNLLQMFMAAVAMAVGAVPEGLPAAVTVTLAIGVSRMARRRAIIRHLPAVETLGSTTVICSDKTGTLTRDEMTVLEIFAGGESFEVSGSGYEKQGIFRFRGTDITPAKHPALVACLRAGFLCNDTTLTREKDRSIIHGDPTEAALIVAAEKAGLTARTIAGEWARLDAIPFEPKNQFMATLHARDGAHILVKKGARELIISECRTTLNAAGAEVPIDQLAVQEAAKRMAARGLRVLAFAQCGLESSKGQIDSASLSHDLTFLGLQGMLDAPRPEASEAVRKCQAAGIVVKVVTGDDPLTASAVARQIGLTNRETMSALSGQELALVPEEQLPLVAERTSIFARVTPAQKLRLIQALQSRGHIVAATGDGVNDAPALRQADIGVAMGKTGTDVARGAADMVLTDDHFATIVAAVEEGRSIFDNLRKFIVWTLPTNAGEACILLLAVFLGGALPILPLQLLWINMTEPIFGLTLAFEPKEAGLMNRAPRPPQQPIMTLPLLFRSGLVSLLMVAGAFALFLWELNIEHGSIAQARTVVVNAIVVIEGFYLLNCRSLTRSVVSVGFFSNCWLLLGLLMMTAAQVAFTYAPFMNHVFHSAPLSAGAWARVVFAGAIVFLAIGVEKSIRSSELLDGKMPQWMRGHRSRLSRQNAPWWRRAIVLIIGGALLLVGITMLVLPGPAFIFIPVGLAVLATEFAWARQLLTRARIFVRQKLQKNRRPQGSREIVHK